MDQPWPSDWLRGVLEVCALRVLADGPTYGYAIGARLAEMGLGTPKGGTLYPLLSRFEAAGLVSVEWRAGESGPGRKFYELTDTGRASFAQKAARWAEFARLTTDLIGPVDAAPVTHAPLAPPQPPGSPPAQNGARS